MAFKRAIIWRVGPLSWLLCTMIKSHPIFQLSDELAKDLTLPYGFPLYDSSKKLEVTKLFCGIAMEHAAAVRLLAFNELYTSAISVTRSQFEALVRATWILYAANELQITKISSDLTPESEQGSKNLPQVNDMLTSLSKIPAAQQFYKALSEFKDYSWLALNSYVHAGIHALNRNATGYPEDLIIQIIKISNALSVITSVQLAVLTGNNGLIRQINALSLPYKDCLPLHQANGA